MAETEERNYEKLAEVLRGAFDQAAIGKGRVRHAEGEPFENQVICEVARRLSGHPAGGPLQQVVKKVYESGRLPLRDGINELRGAINYAAAAIIVMEELAEAGEASTANKRRGK